MERKEIDRLKSKSFRFPTPGLPGSGSKGILCFQDSQGCPTPSLFLLS